MSRYQLSSKHLFDCIVEPIWGAFFVVVLLSVGGLLLHKLRRRSLRLFVLARVAEMMKMSILRCLAILLFLFCNISNCVSVYM